MLDENFFENLTTKAKPDCKKTETPIRKGTDKETRSLIKTPFNRAIALLIVFDKEPITQVSGDNPIEIDEPFESFGR